MAQMKGRSAVSTYLTRDLPEQLISRVLRGAARAGAKVIADEARARSVSAEVGDAIIIRSRTIDHRIIVRVTVKPGWTYARALWLEYGTSPHFISVSDRQRGGQGLGRINAKVNEAGGDASLVINGEFVGDTVWHPGARPHPFLRVSLDLKAAEAISTAQAYINTRVSRSGITGQELSDDE